MFRITPFRQRSGWGSFLPQAFSDFFNWPEGAWQGFNVDVKETAQGYELQADLPGVCKENIKITLNDGYLTIAIRQEDVLAEENENYIRRERKQLSNQRSFYVGRISPEDVHARHENGVLYLQLPKAVSGPNGGQISIH